MELGDTKVILLLLIIMINRPATSYRFHVCNADFRDVGRCTAIFHFNFFQPIMCQVWVKQRSKICCCVPIAISDLHLCVAGFHLSATVMPPQTLSQGKGSFEVAIIFDRRRITLCNCTCSSNATWCAHVVALCLFRIHQVGFLLDYHH